MNMKRATATLLLFLVSLATPGSTAPLAPGEQGRSSAKKIGKEENLSTPGYSGLTCDVCKIIVDVIDQSFIENKTQDEIVELATAICIDLQIEDRNVCTLVVKEFQVAQYKPAHLAIAGCMSI